MSPPATPATNTANHITGPPIEYESTIDPAVNGTPSAITSRRPRTSAMRPPMINPMPAGVAVVSVNRAISVAEYPRTSSR